MNTKNTSPSDSTTRKPSAIVIWLSRLIRLALVAAILGAGAWKAHDWMTDKPTAKRRPPKANATLVEAISINSTAQRAIVTAFGTVEPVRNINLVSRVGGQIMEINPHFTPGGFIKADELVLQIEPDDYRLIVEQRNSDLAKARNDLKMEMGQQSIAMKEYELLEQVVQDGDQELLLRHPQLATAKANILAAHAALQRARLDLERTKVTAPFNAVVQSKNVNLGSQVNSGMTLASMVGTDEYWIQVSVPVDELKWIEIAGRDNKKGSLARIYYESAWGAGVYRQGRVDRLLTELEPQGRMARLLVAVTDPLDLHSSTGQTHALLLNSYVRVEIDGRMMEDVLHIPRTALREGRYIWVMLPDETLDIRETEVAWSGGEYICINDSLAQGERLVVSDLASPVKGMKLRTGAARPEKQKKGKPNQKELAESKESQS
jgi:RND family efflux transporter MFP subunit